MATQIKKISIAVSPYDRAASWVIALNILFGFGVMMLFLIWLSQAIDFGGEVTTVILVDNPAGRGDHAAGYERDVEAPGVEELEEETQPKVEQLLEAVTDVVTTQAAAVDEMQTEVFSSNSGNARGDSRPPGPLGEGDGTISRGERWSIRYNSNNPKAYAQQLDFFKIELGSVGGGEKQVDYAFNLRKARPDHRRGPGGASEQRLYMLWTTGTLKKFDRQLLRSAGIKTAGRIVMQFYPKKIENLLATLELQYARSQGKTDKRMFKKTVFGVRRKGAGFEYYVMSMVFRAIPT